MDEEERGNGGGPVNEQGPGDSGPGDQRPAPGGPPPWAANARRRRGRRGRGGRPPGAPPFRPAGAPPEEDEGSSQTREVGAYERRQQGQLRGGWRAGPGGGRPWSGGPAGVRPPFGGAARPPYAGGGRPSPGGPRPPFAGRPGGMRPGGGRPPQRYQDMVRRATSGPRIGPPEEAGEPIAGPHAVIEALRAGRAIRRIYVAQERGLRTGAPADLVREAQERRVQILFVDRLDVERLSPGVEHQGVVAIAEGREGVELDELLLHLETVSDPPLVLLIDSLQDPQNFGVLLRSAEGAGVDGVVIPRHRQVGLTPAVARTSAGASEHLLVADVANLRQAVDALKERGIWVVGTDDSGDLEWDAVDYRGPTAIVVGGEGEGIRRLVLEGCDQVVRIPMQGKVSSLNAAAAGTILLFEALRQRMRDAAPPIVERRPPPPPEPARDEGVPEEEPAEDLLLDHETPTGDEVHGDDQDVEELDESAADREPAEPTAEPVDAAPKPTRATKRTAAKKTAAKRTTKKKTDGG